MSHHEKPVSCFSLVTTQRDELFAIGRLIAEGLEPEFLHDWKKPVTVSICGSFSSGKSIIAEEGRQALIGSTEMTRGHKDYAEHWEGRRDGKPLEIIYTDGIIAEKQYKKPALNPFAPSLRPLREIFNRRQQGGITYVQNSRRFARREADIAVWVEDRCQILDNNPVVDVFSMIFLGSTKWTGRLSWSPLRQEFNAKRGDWTRYVEVNVRNPRILQSEKFQHAMAAIRDIGEGKPLNKDLLKRIKDSAAYKRKPSLPSPLLFDSSGS